MKYQTTQEIFWAQEFGNEYYERNKIEDIVPNKLNLFSEIFENINAVSSFLEFGPNIGINLIPIRKLYPNAKLNAVDINLKALEKLCMGSYMYRCH